MNMELWIIIAYIALGVATSMYMIHFYKIRMKKFDPDKHSGGVSVEDLFLASVGFLVWPFQIIVHISDMRELKKDYGRTPYSKKKK